MKSFVFVGVVGFSFLLAGCQSCPKAVRTCPQEKLVLTPPPGALVVPPPAYLGVPQPVPQPYAVPVPAPATIKPGNVLPLPSKVSQPQDPKDSTRGFEKINPPRPVQPEIRFERIA